ncbi:beta-lactamase-like protein [Apodospora peruviana]|uniref:Beta-lactamase-like protein n=1 Tax=Apodospora peruviana TaxID=516989 RepID=A0AAE0M516_9PEZI|nr:beta-lactamase-like protein [Apodospora peruviana]
MSEQPQQQPIIHPIFEPATSTWQYIVADPSTKSAVVIDSVLDFDPAKNAIFTSTADALLALINEKGYTVVKILETHVHADHLTASRYLQARLSSSSSGGNPPELCIGKRITQVQERFARRYGIEKTEYEGVFDRLLDDDDVFRVGEMEVKALHLPGHTPDHIGYLIGYNVFCGDSLFNGDVGSARCDFPGGNAHDLYNSAQKLLSLPATHRIWTGHDYPPGGESGRTDPVPYTTVADQKRSNKHLKTGTTEQDFVGWRSTRDAGLAEPKLLHQALQFNIRAGRLPAATSTGGDRFLHLPLKIAVSDGLVW